MAKRLTFERVLAGCLALGWTSLLTADDQFATAPALNLVRDVADAVPQLSVDSSFSGYRPEVVLDGRWIAEGQEPPVAWSDRARLGNGGNTWVSGEAPTDHWIRLDWPRTIRVDTIEIVWSLREWQPKAIRIQRLAGDEWLSLDPAVAAWEPASRHCVIATAPVELQSLRLLQPVGCGGARELLAAQEIAVFCRDGGHAAGSQGVQALDENQLRRLLPAPPRENIALLDRDAPGASCAVSFGPGESRTIVPALADGDLQTAPSLIAQTMAVGVEWPIRHVVNHAALATAADVTPADSLVLEMFDERTWVPVQSGLKVTVAGDRRRVAWTFAPVATRALRVRSADIAEWRPVEMEVDRYWPADKSTWPDRLVQRGVLQSELLAGGVDPSFEQVAAAALSMSPARTFVGVKDDRQEIGVGWDGAILGRETLAFVIGPERRRFAESRETLRRELLDGWRPAVVTTAQLSSSLRASETVFAIALDSTPVRTATFVRLQLTNLADQPLACPVQVDMRSDRTGPTVCVDSALRRGNDVVLICQPPNAATLGDHTEMMQLNLTIPAQGSVAVDFVHPHDADLGVDELTACRTTTYDQALAKFTASWDTQLRDAVKLSLPEPRVERMYRAVLAQLLINADGDVMPYGAAPSVYEGALFGIEESYAMLALADWGLAADAQRYLSGTYLTPDFLRKVDVYRDYADRHQQYRNGLEPHYAVAAYRLSRDRAWVGRHLPLMRECAEWTLAQRKKTMEMQDGQRPLHWGLLPPWSYGGDIAEVECYALFANFCCWRGLADTAWLLEELGDEPTARRYRDEAAEYRRDIQRAMAGSYHADATPPFLPLRLYATKADEQMDYYQLFAGCLLDVEFLQPNDPAYRWIVDYLEADNRMFCGLPRFRRDAGSGGLDALYGKGYLLSKLREDAVREYLLGFYAFLAFNLDHDTFTSRETNVLYASDLHVRSPYPVPDASDPVPCSSAVALHLLRHMLATELSDGAVAPDTLLLLAGTPRAWLSDGNAIRFEQLPTVFGPASLSVESHVGRDEIVVDVELPQRQPAAVAKLRLRHPDARPIQSVRVNGQDSADFDRQSECLTLPAHADKLHIVVKY